MPRGTSDHLTFYELCCLFCCPPCPTHIAAKLAFVPPEPTYSLKPDESSYTLFLNNRAEWQFTNEELKLMEVFYTRTSKGNQIACMFAKCSPLAKHTILFSHGNAVDLGHMSSFYVGLGSRINCNIFSYDYSGYGQSQGKPSEKNLYADVDAAWHALQTRYGIRPENIILYGQSIGTVPTIDLASKYEVGGVILHSPLTSGMRVAFPNTKRTWFFDSFPRNVNLSFQRMGSNVFQAFREHGRPTYYGDNRWPVTADTVVYGILYAFLAIAFSFYVAIIGIRGIERVYVFTRVTISLFIGAVILICNFGYGWEYGSLKATTQYKSFVNNHVRAEIGLKVGLRGINVTLIGLPQNQLNETINYNERFSWEWAQGKPGFGEDTGRFNQEYRAAQWKGLPYPILWVVEYFTIDEGNFRHGRYYRLAGWFCHISLWMAFPLWLLSNILFFMVIRYGAYFLSLTGGCLLLSNILFCCIRNAVPVELRFQSKLLILNYGWCFWLVLFTGLLCELLTVIIMFMDLRYPEEIAVFFGTDILQDYEDFYVDPSELGLIPAELKSDSSTSSESSVLRRSSQQEFFTLRKRTMSSRFQRVSQRRPMPAPRQQDRIIKGQTTRASELPVYENLNLTRFDPIGEEDESKDASFEKILLRDIKSLNE